MASLIFRSVLRVRLGRALFDPFGHLFARLSDPEHIEPGCRVAKHAGAQISPAPLPRGFILFGGGVEAAEAAADGGAAP